MKKETKSGIILLTVGLIFSFVSCTNKICKTPTKREIRKAMSYSTWKYVMPSFKN